MISTFHGVNISWCSDIMVNFSWCSNFMMSTFHEVHISHVSMISPCHDVNISWCHQFIHLMISTFHDVNFLRCQLFLLIFFPTENISRRHHFMLWGNISFYYPGPLGHYIYLQVPQKIIYTFSEQLGKNIDIFHISG